MARTVSLVFVAALVAFSSASTILEIAESLPQFSTLVAAASKAGIAPLLADPGYKTVFAPTNDAFAALGNNTAAWILNAHNQQHLLSTLYYHITSGAQTTNTFTQGLKLATLDQHQGGAETVAISRVASGWAVNNDAIAMADVKASNGIIQVINSVLVPSNIYLPSKDIVQTAIATPALSTLVKAVVAAGLQNALSAPNGPYVVFAPTDAAFAAVPSNILQCLLSNRAALQSVLLFHVAQGYVYSEQLANGVSVPTLAGKPISFNVGAGISINYAQGSPASNVVLANVDTSNGVVHVIDRVLFDGTGPCA